MSTDASASLTIDIQKALQQAVGDANNAVHAIKKKSKRARDEEGAAAGDAPHTHKKKKKSKHNQEQQANTVLDEVTVDPAAEFTTVMDESPTETTAKPKKKKGKGKERAAVTTETPAEQPPNLDVATSSEDFISAVVAAASATSNAQLPPGPPYDQPMPPTPYMGYTGDFVPYPYAHHPQPFDPSQQQHPIYPDPNLGLPDLNFASNEDLIRSLQDFDMSKVLNVLKTLGEAAAAASVVYTPGPQFVAPPPRGPPVINQRAAKSDSILGRPSRPPRYVQPSAITGPPHDTNGYVPENPDHAHMLANVWMNTSKLNELVKSEGLVYKKGKFSATEEALLNEAIERYRINKGLDQEGLDELIFAKEKGRDAFWSEITSAIPLRPIIAVYHHVRRVHHPLGKRGKWMSVEDETLLAAVAELGQQWEKVSARVGRMSSDCRDRWRNHLQNRELRQTGAWTKEEEEKLTQIVTQMTLEQGKDIDNDIFWGIVSQRMGNTRGRQQCRIKWTDSLSMQLKNSGERPRWSQTDAYILVHKVDSLNVRDDSEIDWKTLPDEHWNFWSAHSLQRRWLTMKRSIKGYEDMSHAEIMDILKTKKAQSLPPPSSSRKKKKVSSAEAVLDASDAEDGGHVPPYAGPSTGPGTMAVAL